MNKKKSIFFYSIKYLRQITAECSSPQVTEITGSFLMKKCEAILSANLLRPIVNTAPLSVIIISNYNKHKMYYKEFFFYMEIYKKCIAY